MAGAIAMSVGGGCAAVSSMQHLNVGAVVELEVANKRDDLRPGGLAPPFSLPTAAGSTFELESGYDRGPLVLVFYRGHWCPWCRRQLAELSAELHAFSSRDAFVAAVSVDAAEDTRRFARDYEIGFPLLVDSDGAVSRRYVGQEADGTAIPGVYIIGRDGRILEQHIGDSAGDRLFAPEIVARLDKHIGPPPGGQSRLRGGFGPLERWQLRIGAGVGPVYLPDQDRLAAYGALEGSVLAPMGRYLALGLLARGSLSEVNTVDANFAVKLRLPTFGDLGEAYILPAGGLTVAAERGAELGWNAGGAIGVQFAITPDWGTFLEVGLSHHHVGPDASEEHFRFFGSLGVAWLL